MREIIEASDLYTEREYPVDVLTGTPHGRASSASLPSATALVG